MFSEQEEYSIQLTEIGLLGMLSFPFENTLTFREGKPEIQNIHDKKYATLKGSGFGTIQEHNQPLRHTSHSGTFRCLAKLVKKVRKAILNIYSTKPLYARL